MRKTIEICSCDRCGKKTDHLYSIGNSVGNIELCETCMTDFTIWLNKFQRSDKPLEMIDNGYSSHDCESHYKCPICGKDYGSWSLMHVEKEFECSCGQKLIVRD